jgi:hypothetical protein
MNELLIGAGALVVAGLVYFGGIRHGIALQRRSENHAERMRAEQWQRDEAVRREEASARRVSEFVQHVQWLLTPAGGTHGIHLETLQEAGVRALPDSEIRLALREVAARTRIVLPESEWVELEQVDLQKVFGALHGRVNLSGGPPSLIGAVRRLRDDGTDISRGGA